LEAWRLRLRRGWRGGVEHGGTWRWRHVRAALEHGGTRERRRCAWAALGEREGARSAAWNGGARQQRCGTAAARCEAAAAGRMRGGGRSAKAAAARDGREAGETEKAKPAARGQ